MPLSKSDRESVRAYLADTVSPEMQRLATMAAFDLNYGPYATGFEPDGDGWTYPGWGAAVDTLSALDIPRTLYLEPDSGFVSEVEPSAWQDEDTGDWFDPEPYYELSARDIRSILFGKDLTEYL